MEQQPNLFDLQIDPFTSNHLSEAAKWAKFLAIIGFIVCGIMALMGLFAGTFMGTFLSSGSGVDMPGAGAAAGIAATVFLLLFVLLYFFPCLYLFRFATRMQRALRTNDQQQLVSSFANLKSTFKYLGIVTIIFIAIYAMMFVFQIAAFSALS